MTDITNETNDDTISNELEIDAGLLNEYLKEAFQHYRAIEDAKGDLKLIGEALEEKTGIKAVQIMKYAKARFDHKTKAATELGELFEKLNVMTEST